jgi:hypothetical protein
MELDHAIYHVVLRKHRQLLPPFQITVQFGFAISKSSFKFDQVYRKMHKHPKHQISFFKFSVKYVLIDRASIWSCRCYDMYLQTWSKLEKFNLEQNQSKL